MSSEPVWTWRDASEPHRVWCWEIAYDARRHRVGYGHYPADGGRHHEGGGYSQCADAFLADGPLLYGGIEIPEEVLAALRAHVLEQAARRGASA